jgi:hypothetical protein
MKRTSFRRPSAGTVIGLVALFIALGGAAYALPGKHKVKAGDIAKHAVGHRNIRPGAVHTGDLRAGAATTQKVDVVHSSIVSAANATNSHGAVGLGGPAVKVTVPPGALLEVYAQAQISVTGKNTGQVHLYAPRILSSAPQILGGKSSKLQVRRTAPGPSNLGVVEPYRAGYLVFSPPPGHYVLALAYSTSGGTATFQNRSLFVRVLR